MKPNQPFKTRGFYLHACWKFNYPFAVRSWDRADYTAMFHLLRLLGMDRVMLWPMLEAVPPPLSDQDAAGLAGFRHTIADAQAEGLETWIVVSPCLSSRPEIRYLPLAERHLYPMIATYRLDQAGQFAAYSAHLEQLLALINNADGYAVIDGDPGGYPGAKPEDYILLLNEFRRILNQVGVKPEAQKVIPWIWCGWGTDWAGQGAWKPALRPLVEPVLQLLKEKPLEEPWEMLPGRSIREDWANGRINLELTEEAGLVNRSTLMTYEIVEYEPTPPAVVLQFEDIRRVLRQEGRYAGEARGVFGNCQQPLMSLPNLFYFARCAADPACLDWSDERVLEELASFLGGPADLLGAAWSCLRNANLSADLPNQLRSAHLTSLAAASLPGGPERYLEILAAFVEVRLAVLTAVAQTPLCDRDAAIQLSGAVAALARWWRVHEYVFSGEGRLGFDLEYTHPLLWQPLSAWVRLLGFDQQQVVPIAAELLAEEGLLNPARAEVLLAGLFSA